VPNFQPPETPPDAPAEKVLAKGTILSRVHSSNFAGAQFNPTPADSHWGGARFDSTTESEAYDYLYAGSDDECAVCETLLRDLPLAPSGGRLLPRSAIKGRVLSRLVLTADISLISLCDGKDLARCGQGDNWLISCPSSEYGFTRRWAHALRKWAPKAEGIVWSSRRDVSKQAYIIFGDRFHASFEDAPGGLPPAAGGIPLDSGVGGRYLLGILGEYRVTLAP